MNLHPLSLRLFISAWLSALCCISNFLWFLVIHTLATTLAPTLTQAAPPPASPLLPEPSLLCLRAIATAEQQEDLPASLLYAIALTESGRRFDNGAFGPWPWTINADGKGLYLDSQTAAVALSDRLLGQGARNIDLGCLQISSQYHPRAFPSLSEAFTPEANARYAARLLRSLYQRLGSWEKAVAHYHSADPQRGPAYQQRVYAVYDGDLQTVMAQAEQRERLQGPILAASRLLSSDPGAAVRAFSAILEGDPNDTVALAGRALALQYSGEGGAALDDLLRLYLQTPDDRQVWVKLARSLSALPTTERMGTLERLAAQNPQDIRVRDWLVRDALAMGDDTRAYRHKLALIDLSPNEPRLYLDGAEIAERLDRPLDALDLCEAALSLPRLSKDNPLQNHLQACTRRLRAVLIDQSRTHPTDGLSGVN